MECLTCTISCTPCNNSRETILSPPPSYTRGIWVVESNLVKVPPWVEKPGVKPGLHSILPPHDSVAIVFTISYFSEFWGSKVHWGSQNRRCGNHRVATLCTVWGSAQNRPLLHTCLAQLPLRDPLYTSVNLKASLSTRPWLRSQCGQGLSPWQLWRQQCSFTVQIYSASSLKQRCRKSHQNLLHNVTHFVRTE